MSQRYAVDAVVTLRIDNIIVRLEDDTDTQALEDKVLEKLRKNLVLLDIKGSRSGDDGFVDEIRNVTTISWVQI